MKKNTRLLFASAAFCVTLALVSCTNLRASAVDISASEQAGIYDYLDAAESGMALMDFRLDTNADGSRSTRLKIYALQQLAFSEQFGIYDNMDFSLAPSTVNVTISGGAGLCKYQDRFYPVTLYNGTSVLAQSDIFKIYIGTDVVNSGISFRAPSSYPNNCYGTRLVNPHSVQCSIRGTGIFSGGSGIFSGNVYVKSSTTGIPIMGDSEQVSGYAPYDGSTPTRNICGLAQTVELPTATVDTKRPWEYYNNVVLPYLQQNYPDFMDYFVFPDGYDPPNQPTTIPVEYPTLPGFDYALETNGTEPASDYNYNVPELPGKDIAVPAFDFTQINPAEIMAPVASGLSGLWALITGVLTEYNLFPYVAIAVLAAIVAGIMHLGK